MNKGEQIKWDESEIGKELASRIVEKFNKKKKPSTNPNRKSITQMASL